MLLLASYEQINIYFNPDSHFCVIVLRLFFSLSLSNNTLWNILEEPKIINASEFEHLFAKTATPTKRKPLSETYEKKAKARKVTSHACGSCALLVH